MPRRCWKLISYSCWKFGGSYSFLTYCVLFFCLFLIERCIIKLWKSSLKLMIHLKYFLQKFIQLHSIFLKWWNVSKSLTMFFISTWWGNWQTVSRLQFWSAISLTIHIANKSNISENFSVPVRTKIAAPPHDTNSLRIENICRKLKSQDGFFSYLQYMTANLAHLAALFWPVLFHTQKTIAIIIDVKTLSNVRKTFCSTPPL